jgi:hypothetical protein
MVEIRRVVTGQSRDGKAMVTSDGPVPTVFGSQGGPILFEIWKTNASPAIITDQPEEPAAGPLTLEPPVNGTLFRIAVIPPDEEMASAANHEIFEQLGEGHSGEGTAAMMHRTSTIDYAIVLYGKVTLIVDEGEADLAAGDVVIQRGANHAWSNRSGEPCQMAFIQIDARYG